MLDQEYFGQKLQDVAKSQAPSLHRRCCHRGHKTRSPTRSEPQPDPPKNPKMSISPCKQQRHESLVSKLPNHCRGPHWLLAFCSARSADFFQLMVGCCINSLQDFNHPTHLLWSCCFCRAVSALITSISPFMAQTASFREQSAPVSWIHMRTT